jgi:NDP-sugar pyrophosphorylase family protein
MKALVLAAGKGTRLGAAANGVPKPLVDVGGATPLNHALAWVAAMRPERIWINVHDAATVVRERTGAAVAGVPVSYSYEPELLGTAGAWKRLEGEWDETSLVVYGDNFMRFDLQALLRAHRAGGALATLAVFDPARHANTGIGGGRLTLSGSRVTRFEEGGTSGLVNAGAYFLEPALRERVPPGFSDFGHDVFPGLSAAGLLVAHVVEDGAYCLGVDTPERLAIARHMLAGPEVA